MKISSPGYILQSLWQTLSCHGVSRKAAPQEGSEELSFMPSTSQKKYLEPTSDDTPAIFCLVTKGFTLPFWNKIFKYLFLLDLPGKIWTLANRGEDSRAVEYFLLAYCVSGSMSEGYFDNISMVNEERLTPHLCTCLGETQPPPSW